MYIGTEGDGLFSAVASPDADQEQHCVDGGYTHEFRWVRTYGS